MKNKLIETLIGVILLLIAIVSLILIPLFWVWYRDVNCLGYEEMFPVAFALALYIVSLIGFSAYFILKDAVNDFVND